MLRSPERRVLFILRGSGFFDVEFFELPRSAVVVGFVVVYDFAFGFDVGAVFVFGREPRASAEFGSRFVFQQLVFVLGVFRFRREPVDPNRGLDAFIVFPVGQPRQRPVVVELPGVAVRPLGVPLGSAEFSGEALLAARAFEQ